MGQIDRRKVYISNNLKDAIQFNFNGLYIPSFNRNLGFKNISGDFTNRNAKYTKSNHLVTGFDYSLGNAAKISIEGFIKKYTQFPIRKQDPS